MDLIIATISFCVVLFIYLHVFYHLKRSNDLEIYELEQPSKDQLHEICDLRQPVLFDYELGTSGGLGTRNRLRKDYGAFDINIKTLKQIGNNEGEDNEEDTMEGVPIAFSSAMDALEGDKEGCLMIEDSEEFLKETGAIRDLRYNDTSLRPSMVSSCTYNWIAGADNVTTQLQYRLDYRNYITVTEGEVVLKLVPPKYGKYLHEERDYDRFKFTSPLNVWNIQEKYNMEFGKIKVLDIKLKPGKCVYIPAYWWYSIKCVNNASICNMSYRTYMNNMAIIPQIALRFLQSKNTRLRMVKIMKTV